MTTSEKYSFGAVVVVVALLLGWAVNHVNFSNKGVTFGAAGNLLAENYINYVRQNGGYNSADPIVTTGGVTLSGGTTITGVASFSGLTTLSGGLLQSNTSATTTAAATEAFVIGDLNGFSTVILNPNVAGNTTLTLPASSTVSTWLPTAGNTQTTCFINGTTTANVYYIFAGGTGTTLLVSSSTATVVGSPRLGPQKEGCFTFTRGNSTATTFDILSAYSAFQ